jgi:hypothetical protein
MTPDVWAQMEWDENAVPFLSFGTDDIDFDDINKKILINTDGVYQMRGLANINGVINDLIDAEIRIGGISVGLILNGIGMNTGTIDRPVGFAFEVTTPLSINDDITLWTKTSGTEIVLHNISFTIEKLPYTLGV